MAIITAGIRYKVAVQLFVFSFCFTGIGFGIASLVLANAYFDALCSVEARNSGLGFGISALVLGGLAIPFFPVMFKINCNADAQSKAAKVIARIILPWLVICAFVATVVLAALASHEVFSLSSNACRSTGFWLLQFNMYVAFWVVCGVVFLFWALLSWFCWSNCVNGHPHGPGFYMTDEVI